MIRLRHYIVFGLWLASWPARADVISYLRFEEGSGWFTADETGLMDGALDDFATDLSAGSGDSGPEGWSVNVPSSSIPQSGQPNTGSLRFAGGGAYVNMSSANDVNLGTSFTVEFYFNAEAPLISPVFGFQQPSSLGLALTMSSEEIYFNMTFQDQTPYTPATGVSTGIWYHLALVKEPSEYSLYLDGNLIANEAVSSSADGPYFFFGTDVAGDRSIGGFSGYIDEFRISDTALTPDQFLIVPEPSTLVLISLGLLGVCGRRFAGRRTAGR